MTEKKDERKDERIHPFMRLMVHWSSPAGVVVIIGFVIWLIQLNMGFVAISKDIAVLKEKHHQQTQALQTIQRNADKTSLILNGVVNRLEDAVNDLEDHNEQSQEWKRKILLNEEKVNRLDK